jgi:hypothetical protein
LSLLINLKFLIAFALVKIKASNFLASTGSILAADIFNQQVTYRTFRPGLPPERPVVFLQHR